jgi:hypothetical protein
MENACYFRTILRKKNRSVLTLFRKNTDIHKIRPVEVPLFSVEKGTDGRTDMKIIIGYFCKCCTK